MRVPDRLTRMVRHDGHRLHREFPDPPAIEQVGEEMVELADHDEHSARPIAADQLPVHPEFACDLGEVPSQTVRGGTSRVEFDAHEEGIRRAVVELLRLEDIAASFEQERRDARGDAGAVGAGQGEDERTKHRSALAARACARQPQTAYRARNAGLVFEHHLAHTCFA